MCGKMNTAKLERVQLRALRFIYNDNDSSYETLLARSGLCTLELSRTSKAATEVYKAVNDLSLSYICNLFQTKSSTYNLRKSGLNVKNVRTTKYGLSCFVFFWIPTLLY